MEFIKRNYEKIILSLVLLGLVGALAFMPVVIYYDQQQMADAKNNVTHPKTVPLQELNLSRQQAVLDRLKSPYKLDLSTTNQLFNPVQWQKDKSGAWIKIMTGHEVGPGAAVVAKITPLYYIISLDSVATNALGAPPRYTFTVEHQASALPAQRHPQHQYASVGEKARDFSLPKQGVKGPPENPDQLTLKLADTGDEVTVSKDKPFRRVDAYSADLKYSPENYSRSGQRVGDHLTFAGDDYNVIAIDKNEVILLAQSNQKKYTLPLRNAP
jgi:hypothetical protein